MGSYLDNAEAGGDAGSAYVFARSGAIWAEEAHLTAFDGAVGDYLGISVAVDGDTTVVGASGDDTVGGFQVGSAYVFARSGTVWTEQTKLSAPDGGSFDEFGISVALSAGTAVVGAWNDDTPQGADAGSTYVYERSGTAWIMQAKLTASDGAGGDEFGVSVAVEGNTAMVGAYNDTTPAGTYAGSAYLFGRSGTNWTERTKLTPPDAASYDQFGASVALSYRTALAGAFEDETPSGAAAGSAWVYWQS